MRIAQLRAEGLFLQEFVAGACRQTVGGGGLILFFVGEFFYACSFHSQITLLTRSCQEANI